MKPRLCRLVQEEQGQDFVEYTLLLAFIALCSAAFLVLQGDSIATIWQATNENLLAGQRVAAS